MMGRVARIFAGVVAVLGLAVGCGSSDRPEDLSLSGAKPCQLILTPRLETLKVTRGPTVSEYDGVGTEGSSCRYGVVYGRDAPQPGSGLPTSNTVQLIMITNEGVDWKVDQTADSESFDSKDVARIQGYRTVRAWSVSNPPGPNSDCELFVDVADDQMLHVNVDTSTGETDPPTCETARRFADAALKTLRARQG